MAEYLWQYNRIVKSGEPEMALFDRDTEWLMEAGSERLDFQVWRLKQEVLAKVLIAGSGDTFRAVARISVNEHQNLSQEAGHGSAATREAAAEAAVRELEATWER